MNDKQRKTYLKNPSQCPKCDSEEIWQGTWEYGWEIVSCNAVCNDCHFEWNNTYALVDVGTK